MNGSVRLKVTNLALAPLGSDTSCVRVTAGGEQTGDLLSISVLAADAPPIGSTIEVRIVQAEEQA